MARRRRPQLSRHPANRHDVYDALENSNFPGAVAIISENPYRLARHIRGIGFKTAVSTPV